MQPAAPQIKPHYAAAYDTACYPAYGPACISAAGRSAHAGDSLYISSQVMRRLMTVSGPMTGYGYAMSQQPVQYRTARYGAEREKNLNEVRPYDQPLFTQGRSLSGLYEKCKTDIVRYSRNDVAPLVWGIIICVIGLGLVFSAVLQIIKTLSVTALLRYSHSYRCRIDLVIRFEEKI